MAHSDKWGGGGATGFLKSTKSGGTEIFQNQGGGGGGEKKWGGGGEGNFEIFIGGKIAGDETSNGKQTFRMNLKMFSWVI